MRGASALVIMLASCAAPPAPYHVRPEDRLPPIRELADARAWSWVSTSALFGRYLPAPADALGEYFEATPDRIITLRGPAFEDVCAAGCTVPFAPKIGSQFFYLGADRRPVVIAWDAVAAVLHELEAKQGATADHDPEVVALRGVVAAHRLPVYSQAWLQRQPDGSLWYFDSFPVALELDPRLAIDPDVTGDQAIPLGVVVSSRAVRARLSRPAEELAPSDRVYRAAIAGSAPSSAAKLTARPMEHGWLVSIVGPCAPRTVEVYVDADAERKDATSTPGGNLHDYAFAGVVDDCPK